jgi:hypothetical protein
MVGFIEGQYQDYCSQDSGMEKSIAEPSSGFNSKITARELQYQLVPRKGG